jgi:hypothetical protein
MSASCACAKAAASVVPRVVLLGLFGPTVYVSVCLRERMNPALRHTLLQPSNSA